jgi:hypothetical protein
VHVVGTKSKLTKYDYSSSYWAVQNMCLCVCIKGNLSFNTYVNSCVHKNRHLQLTYIICHVMDVSREGGQLSEFCDSNVLCLGVQFKLLYCN